jgi:phytoene desaturase
MTKRVLIVGAGPGGLASAILLAGAGLDVTVVERQPRVGGRTSAITDAGYRFDLGPTFFLYPQVLQEIFAAAGRDLFKEVPMRRLDPQYRIIFGAGGELNATPNIPRMIEQIAKLAPADAPAFQRFMDDNRVKLEKFTPCLQSPFPSWTSLLQARLLALLPYLKPWKSLHAELAGYFRDPRMQLAFTFQAKYLGMSPFQCPSLFSILSYLEYEYGVWHPIGGCNALSVQMARVAEELGVKFRLNEPVEEILFTGRRAVGVRTAAGETRADAVLVNADFGHAMTTLVPAKLRRKWTDKAIAGKRFSCSTFMLYLGIEGRYDQLAHHNIYIAKDYTKNLDEIERLHVLSEDPSFYIQNAGVTDDTLAPPGHSTLYVLVPVSHQHPNIDWNKERRSFRQLALRQIAQLGLGDIESRIRFERMVTPLEWEKNSGIYLGATFNLSHNLGQMLHRRPRNRFEEFERFYLTGGGTHPGSGLPVIFESARISSRLLLQDLGLPVTIGPPAPIPDAATFAAGAEPVAR